MRNSRNDYTITQPFRKAGGKNIRVIFNGIKSLLQIKPGWLGNFKFQACCGPAIYISGICADMPAFQNTGTNPLKWAPKLGFNCFDF